MAIKPFVLLQLLSNEVSQSLTTQSVTQNLALLVNHNGVRNAGNIKQLCD